MTERQKQLLAGVCLRYHGAVEIDAAHVMDVCESVRAGMMEVDDGAVFISDDWWSRLSDLDTHGLALAVSAGIADFEGDTSEELIDVASVSARNISGEVM